MPVRQWLSRFTSVRRRKVLRRKRLLPAETGTLRSAEWLEDRTLLSATDLLSYVATTAEHLDERHEHGDDFGDRAAVDDTDLTGWGQSQLPDLPGLILVDPDTDDPIVELCRRFGVRSSIHGPARRPWRPSPGAPGPASAQFPEVIGSRARAPG